jgi:DNA processing protein
MDPHYAAGRSADNRSSTGETICVAPGLVGVPTSPQPVPMERIRAGAPEYPDRLFDLPDPPAALELRGAPLPVGPTAGIIGSRRPSPDGMQFAEGLAAGLAGCGVAVISGGALGIDGAAHRGALGAEGRTWAVLVGLAPLRPRTHGALFVRIERSGGGLVAEADGPNHNGAYLHRNRLVAALSDVLVVVQARERSGTASTAQAAARIGRPVGAVPWGPYEPAGRGCRRLLEAGAFFVSGVEDVLQRLELAAAPDASKPSDPWLEAIHSAGHTTVEDLAERMNQPTQSVLRQLSRLEIEGRVRVEGGVIRPLRVSAP